MSSLAERVTGSWIPVNLEDWKWTNKADQSDCEFFDAARTRCSLDLMANMSRIDGSFSLNGIGGTIEASPLANNKNSATGPAKLDEPSIDIWRACSVKITYDCDLLKVYWTFTGGPCGGKTYQTVWAPGTQNARHCCVIA